MSAVYGWCARRSHDAGPGAHDGRVDHRRRPACAAFVSDAEATAAALTAAVAQDARTTYGYPTGAVTPEGHMVAVHAPAAAALPDDGALCPAAGCQWWCVDDEGGRDCDTIRRQESDR